ALEVVRGTRKRPYVPNEHGDLLRRKGEEHEAAYLGALRAQGRQVVDVIGADRWDFEGSARATIEAMNAGAEVIYQATFVVGDWRGRAGFFGVSARQARAGGEAHLRLAALLLLRRDRGHPGRAGRGDACLARHRRATDAASRGL